MRVKRTLLILLVIVCGAVAIWNGYLLLTEQTNTLTGWVLLAVSIGVLFWNISVLRAYRIHAKSVIAVFLCIVILAMSVGAFSGVSPFVQFKDKIDNLLLTFRYDVAVPAGGAREVEGWAISLNGGGWKGGDLIIELTITNKKSTRRYLGYSLFGQTLLIMAIDSSGKVVEPEMAHPYAKEYYPQESWSGKLTFALSPYSGRTVICIGEYYKHYLLFDVGEPKSK